MKRYLEALPPLRPLTFVLKYFLAARELNVPYSGGVGSYMLQLMIVAFLQQRERVAKNFQHPSVYNLGSLLLEFLALYGMELNFVTTGISVRFDGFFFPKGAADRKAVFCSSRGYNLLAFENPLDPTQDVGQSSFRYLIVHRAFKVAYHIVLAHATATPHEHELRDAPSILAAILPPTDYMTSRLVLKRRDRPLAAPRGRSSNSSSTENRNKREHSGGGNRGDDRKRARK
jgi:non-canonical poly(A) RNA polymerase PAPD5/7